MAENTKPCCCVKFREELHLIEIRVDHLGQYHMVRIARQYVRNVNAKIIPQVVIHSHIEFQ